MSDVVTGVRQAIQDLVAPDLKAHGAKLDALQKQLEMQQAALQKQVEMLQAGLHKQMELSQRHADAQYESVLKSTNLQYEALIKTMDGLRAEMRSGFSLIERNQQLEVLRQMGPLSERVTALETNNKRA